MKIRPVGAELFRADGQTDRHDEAKVAFRNFSNAHKNGRASGDVRSGRGNWLCEIFCLQTAVAGWVRSQSVSWALNCHSVESVNVVTYGAVNVMLAIGRISQAT